MFRSSLSSHWSWRKSLCNFRVWNKRHCLGRGSWGLFASSICFKEAPFKSRLQIDRPSFHLLYSFIVFFPPHVFHSFLFCCYFDEKLSFIHKTFLHRNFQALESPYYFTTLSDHFLTNPASIPGLLLKRPLWSSLLPYFYVTFFL